MHYYQLDPDALIDAITRTVFVVYSIICVVLAITLAILSNRPIGQELVWIDLGLCALFGESDRVRLIYAKLIESCLDQVATLYFVRKGSVPS